MAWLIWEKKWAELIWDKKNMGWNKLKTKWATSKLTQTIVVAHYKTASHMGLNRPNFSFMTLWPFRSLPLGLNRPNFNFMMFLPLAMSVPRQHMWQGLSGYDVVKPIVIDIYDAKTNVIRLWHEKCDRRKMYFVMCITLRMNFHQPNIVKCNVRWKLAILWHKWIIKNEGFLVVYTLPPNPLTLLSSLHKKGLTLG